MVSNGDVKLEKFSIGPFSFDVGDYTLISESKDSILLHNIFQG